MKLEVHQLDCFYGRAQILFGITLRVAAGEAVALLGRNGAGKSTTLRSIIGLAPNTHGAWCLMVAKSRACPPAGSSGGDSVTCPRTGASSPT